MQLLRQMLASAGSGAAVAGALFFVLARRWKSAMRWTGAIAIGAGYLAGHVLAAGWSPFSPRRATDWVFWFPVIGVIAASANALIRPKQTVRLVAWGTICSIACRLILQPKFNYDWSAPEGWLRVFAIAAGVVVLTCCFDLIERRPFGSATLYSITTVLGGGGCIALILSGSLLLGQLACILMAISATCFLFSIALPAPLLPGGAAAPLTLVFAGLWLNGCFYAELPAVSALLLAFAPALALPGVGRERYAKWRILACRIALVAVPVGIAVAVAFRASPPLDY